MNHFPHPLAFVLASTDQGTLILNRNDFRQNSSGHTIGVGYQVLTYGAYEPEELLSLRMEIKKLTAKRGKELVAVDAGANIGITTIELARALNGIGLVVAIEAQERLYYALCGNIALANLYNVKCVLAAVTDFDGEMKVPVPDYNKPGSFGSLELVHNPQTEYIGQTVSYAPKHLTGVRSLAIDSLGLPRLDFLKIDVEGMEPQVLHGAVKSIVAFHPIVFVEHIKTGTAVLIDFLTPLGYEVQTFGMNLLATPV